MNETIIERIVRRLQLLFGRARISYVDDSGPVQIVQVRVNPLETADNRFRLAEFGFSSNPPIDSDALFLGISGDRSAVAAIATNHQPSRPRGLQPGESMLYSQDGKSVYMTATGGIVVEAKGQDVVVNNARNVVWNCSGDFTQNVGGKYTVVAPGGVEFTTPTTEISGTLAIDNEDGAANASTMNGSFVVTGDVVAGTVSLQNHLTSGVQHGTDESGAPVPGT